MQSLPYDEMILISILTCPKIETGYDLGIVSMVHWHVYDIPW